MNANEYLLKLYKILAFVQIKLWTEIKTSMEFLRFEES